MCEDNEWDEKIKYKIKSCLTETWYLQVLLGLSRRQIHTWDGVRYGQVSGIATTAAAICCGGAAVSVA